MTQRMKATVASLRAQAQRLSSPQMSSSVMELHAQIEVQEIATEVLTDVATLFGIVAKIGGAIPNPTAKAIGAGAQVLKINTRIAKALIKISQVQNSQRIASAESEARFLRQLARALIDLDRQIERELRQQGEGEPTELRDWIEPGIPRFDRPYLFPERPSFGGGSWGRLC